MHSFPLEFLNNHLFVNIDGHLWLIDTGAPTSFGNPDSLNFAGKHFALGTNYLGLTAEKLSLLVSVPTAGLLGLDVLTHFDHIFNVPAGTLTVSTDPLPHAGQPIPLDEFMGVPIVTAQILGSSCRMMFDTGAKISYFQHDLLASFPPLGNVKDFYPGFGEFETPTYQVAMSLGGIPLTLRCGRLPGLLGDTLMMTTVQGILGNEIFSRRTIGYFPRWRKITI